MNRFFGFIKKEFLHILRDRRTLVILIGMPIVQLLLFGYVITNEIKDAKIAILDNSKDYLTKKIISKLLSSSYFKLDENLKNYGDIERIFREGNVKLVIVMEQGFAEKLEKSGTAALQIISDASEPNTANILVSYATAIINGFLLEQKGSMKRAIAINPEVRMLYNPSLKGVYMFVPGIMAILLMLISALMTSVSITREKELGTMEILLASPLKPIQIIIGKVVPYLLLSFFNAAVIISLGYLVFAVPVKGSLFLLLGVSLVYILVALALGMLISSITNSQQVAMSISLVALMMPTMLLSGFIYPIENMPLVLRIIARIIPARYYIEIIKDIMLKGSGLEMIWKNLVVLSIMALFLLLFSLKRFKIRLE